MYGDKVAVAWLKSSILMKMVLLCTVQWPMLKSSSKGVTFMCNLGRKWIQ